MQLNTVIFDMDGLLIDSEPLWQEAGKELMAQYGKTLTPAQYETTIGLRTREWVEHWFRYFEIPFHTVDIAEQHILEIVEKKIRYKGRSMPGVQYILEYFKARNFKIGLATSSPMLLANTVVDLLEIRSFFTAITSAQHLPYGKPHPQVYIDCAKKLDAPAETCLCFEDSFNGLIAAKAAKMKCIVVPAGNQGNDKRWGAADLKVSSLQNVNDLLLMRL